MLRRDGRNLLKRKRRGGANAGWHHPRPIMRVPNRHRPPARVPQNQTTSRLNRPQVMNLPRHPPPRAVYHRHLRRRLQNFAKAKQVTERPRRMNPSSFYLNDIDYISVLLLHPSPRVMANHPQKVATVAGD